jgi:hypothetical protein
MATTSNEYGKGSWVFQPLVLVLAADAVLAFRLFLTIRTEAVNIFYWDQWDFNDPILFHPQSLWQAFRHQHGPHRQGLGAFVGLLVGRLSRWNTRSDAFAIAMIVIIASLCALWLKKRLFGFLAYSDVIIPMLFFTRVQWETYLGTTNPAHGSLPLLVIVLYCLAWASPHEFLKYPLVLILNFVAIYTGFGLFLGFVTPVLLALDSYSSIRSKQNSPWYPIVACLLSVASLASFFIDYVRNPDCLSFIHSHPASYLAFVSMMFSGFLAARGFYLSTAAGAVVLAIFIVVAFAQLRRFLIRSDKKENMSAIILALLGFSLLFGSGTAVGRICIESGSGQTSRYMIYLVPAFLGVYFYLLTLEGKLRKWSIATLLVLSLLASFPTGVAHKGTMEKAQLDWKNCYLRLEDVERCDEITNFTVYPPPEAATHLQEKLLYLKQHQLNLYAK